jgi:hypothetical protein
MLYDRAICFVGVLFLAVVSASAQTPGKAADTEKLYAQQLLSDDPGVRQRTIDAIRKQADEHPEALAPALRRSWLRPMAKAGMNEDIAQLTQTALLSGLGSQLVIESMLKPRVYALIALKRNDEALADARRFYNVCTLDQTGVAVDLLVAAMQAKYGEAGELKIRQFRMHQMTAAQAGGKSDSAAPTTDPVDAATTDDAADQLLLSISVDEKPYMTDADKWKANHKQAVAYGNLLLLAGHNDQAYAYFTDLLNKAKTEKDLAIALERQSAAMRAQDGDLTRAQNRLRNLQNHGL